MSSGEILKQKQAVVDEITEKMKNAKSFVLVDYSGITVEHVTALRAKAREAGVDYKVYKNTFMNLAAQKAGYSDLSECFNGITAVAFAEDDAVAPAKVIYNYVKDNKLETLAFKGGVIDKNITATDEIEKIAQLPGKEVLLAKMLGSMNAPIANLVYALDAVRKKLEESA